MAKLNKYSKRFDRFKYFLSNVAIVNISQNQITFKQNNTAKPPKMQASSQIKPTQSNIPEIRRNLQSPLPNSLPKIVLKYIKTDQLYLHPSASYSKSASNPVFNLTYLKQCLIQQQQLDKKQLLVLLMRFKKILQNQQNMVKINGNVTIIGDIHGQFYDFMKILALIRHKYPEMPESLASGSLLFLGDYVDRGYYSIQALTLIMAMKINFPNRIFCLRGNHECRGMTVVYNFKAEVLVKYDQEVYDGFMEAFDALPLCAIVNGAFFCVHGGISDQAMNIGKINDIDRFKEIPDSGAVCDFVWADPVPKSREKMYEDTQFNDTRMCSIFFGKSLVNKFSQKNKIQTILRAHQVFPQGFQRRDWNKHNKSIPSVITIFSAPNYCGMYGNYASILHLTNNSMEIRQFKQQEPSDSKKVNKKIDDVFQWSIPELMRIVNQFVRNLCKEVGESKIFSDFQGLGSVKPEHQIAFLLKYYYEKRINNYQGHETKQKYQKQQYLRRIPSSSTQRLIVQSQNNQIVVQDEKNNNKKDEQFHSISEL